MDSKTMRSHGGLSAGKFKKSALLIDSASGHCGEVAKWKAMWRMRPGVRHLVFECQHFRLKVIQVASSHL